jgi:hypothetical protein
MVNSGTLDFVGPGSVAQGRAQDWPTSPEEAARAIFEAKIFAADRLPPMTLREGVPVDLPGGAVGVQFPTTADDGTTQGLITVEQLVHGFWSATQIATCG